MEKIDTSKIVNETTLVLDLEKNYNPKIILPTLLCGRGEPDYLSLIGTVLPGTKFYYKGSHHVAKGYSRDLHCDECSLCTECNKLNVINGVCGTKNAKHTGAMQYVHFEEVPYSCKFIDSDKDDNGLDLRMYEVDGINIIIRHNKINKTKTVQFDNKMVFDIDEKHSSVVLLAGPDIAELEPYFETEENAKCSKIDAIGKLYEIAEIVNNTFDVNANRQHDYIIVYDNTTKRYMAAFTHNAYGSPIFVNDLAAKIVIDEPKLRYILDKIYKD